MSNSALANFISRKNGNYFERSGMISKIMIHNSFTPGDRYTMAEFINTAENVDFHYGISTDGVIGLFCDEFRAAKGCGNDSVDNYCIHILVMEDGQIGASSSSIAGSVISAIQDVAQLTHPISGDSYDALLNLVEDICRRNFIQSLVFTNVAGTSNILLHKWFDSETSCPGLDIYNRIPGLVKEVNSRLKHARLAEDETEAEKAQSTIPVGATYPYVIMPDPGVSNINYANMREAGVVGTMLFAGNMGGRKYMNQNLDAQVRNADSYHVPFGLYCDVRARNEADARAECRELYYVVSRHSPKLGIWLNLETGADSGTMQNILQIYYDNIVKWGLKGRCGIMATTSQANKAQYKLWVDRFAFWWVNNIDSTNCLENIFTPSMFKL